MLIRIKQFGEENAADFPPASAGGENFAVVGAVIENLREHAAAQTSGAVQNTTVRKAALRDSVREKMKAIARTARALAIDNPNLSRLFRIPDGDNDQKLIATAREFARESEDFKTDLISFGLRSDFIEAIAANITEFEQALTDKAQATGDKVSATASIDDELELGMNAARRLDAIVRNVYQDRAGKLAAWSSARHIARSSRPADVSASPAPTA